MKKGYSFAAISGMVGILTTSSIGSNDLPEKGMTPYRNYHGNSSVIAYETTDDSIQVLFRSGKHRNYLYNNFRPGKATVDRMKALAAQGHGLNSYISTVVKGNFAEKW